MPLWPTLCPACLCAPCRCKPSCPEAPVATHFVTGEDVPETMIDEAVRLINGQRKSDYGPARKNFDDIAAIWSVVLGTAVTGEQVALCMIGLKMARLAKSIGHRDSWVDIVGYVGCVDKMQRGE